MAIYFHFWLLIMDKKELQIAISKRIIQLREEKNISQSELGALCNMDKSNMSRIESGKTSPAIFTLYTIATKLEVDFSELFIFPEKSNKNSAQ